MKPPKPIQPKILLSPYCCNALLFPPIRRQLLLQGKPDTLTQAIKDAVNIDFTLNFIGEADSNSQEVNAVHHKPRQEPSGHNKLQESLDQIVKRLEALETSQR